MKEEVRGVLGMPLGRVDSNHFHKTFCMNLLCSSAANTSAGNPRSGPLWDHVNDFVGQAGE